MHHHKTVATLDAVTPLWKQLRHLCYRCVLLALPGRPLSDANKGDTPSPPPPSPTGKKLSSVWFAFKTEAWLKVPFKPLKVQNCSVIITGGFQVGFNTVSLSCHRWSCCGTWSLCTICRRTIPSQCARNVQTRHFCQCIFSLSNLDRACFGFLFFFCLHYSMVQISQDNIIVFNIYF